MKHLTTVVMVALMLAGCRGSDTSNSGGAAAPTGPLDAGFAKTWSGDFSMMCDGIGTSVFPGGTGPITVSGNSLTARISCEDGTGLDVTATGSGSTATWNGSFSCPPTAVGTCSTWVFTRSSVTYTLNANGTLTTSGIGTLVGCGVTTSCTTLFTGT